MTLKIWTRNEMKEFIRKIVAQLKSEIESKISHWLIFIILLLALGSVEQAEMFANASGWIPFFICIINWIRANNHRRKDVTYWVDLLVDGFALKDEFRSRMLWGLVSLFLLSLFGWVGLPVDVVGWISLILRVLAEWKSN